MALLTLAGFLSGLAAREAWPDFLRFYQDLAPIRRRSLEPRPTWCPRSIKTLAFGHCHRNWHEKLAQSRRDF